MYELHRRYQRMSPTLIPIPKALLTPIPTLTLVLMLKALSTPTLVPTTKASSTPKASVMPTLLY